MNDDEFKTILNVLLNKQLMNPFTAAVADNKYSLNAMLFFLHVFLSGIIHMELMWYFW